MAWESKPLYWRVWNIVPFPVDRRHFTATQSSTLGGYGANLAIDGNTNGHIVNGR